MDERLVLGFAGHTADELKKFFASDPILVQAVDMPNCDRVLKEMVEVLQEEYGKIGDAAVLN